MNPISAYIAVGIRTDIATFRSDLFAINVVLHEVYEFCMWCEIFHRLTFTIIHYDRVQMCKILKNYIERPFDQGEKEEFNKWSNICYYGVKL